MDTVVRILAELWPWVAGVLGLFLAVVVSGHIVLHKRDPRAAVGWAALVWLAPVVGSVLYALLGINRIRRRAGRLRGRRTGHEGHTAELAAAAVVNASLPPDTAPPRRALATLVWRATGRPLQGGNDIVPLEEGDEAYPAMVAAIDGAARSVALATYILDHDRAGRMFEEALARAVERGVAVRVLIDAAGARYSRERMSRRLATRGVRTAEFLPPRFPLANPYLNLRNHRKLLVVDGTLGFTGGMNIREGCLLGLRPAYPTRDVHFRVAGPVVRQMMETFAFDWQFTTGESLEGEAWFPPIAAAGSLVARGIPDGPDEDFEALHHTLMGALTTAERCVRIVTPYFLPDPPLLDALRVAAMRGVEVDIVLPARGNLRLVQWAMAAGLGPVVAAGCRVWLTPPPFDHAKLFTVDGAWALVGSANWDPRSLRLNFEYSIEAYDHEFAARLDALIDHRVAGATRLGLADLRGRPLAVRLRDGVAWLAQPYL